MIQLKYENETTYGGTNYLSLQLCLEAMLVARWAALFPAWTWENSGYISAQINIFIYTQ